MTKKNYNTITPEKEITLDGLMTISKFEDGTHSAEFMCCEDVKTEQFSGRFKVQGMGSGNIYMTELPKRVRNTPIFRDDNSSLSKGKNGRYYFVFSLEEERIEELPEELVRQANAIAKKVIIDIICD
jgi:hypothetical protein